MFSYYCVTIPLWCQQPLLESGNFILQRISELVIKRKIDRKIHFWFIWSEKSVSRPLASKHFNEVTIPEDTFQLLSFSLVSINTSEREWKHHLLLSVTKPAWGSHEHQLSNSPCMLMRMLFLCRKTGAPTTLPFSSYLQQNAHTLLWVILQSADCVNQPFNT